MTKLAIMSDLHIDVNRFTDLEIQTLIEVLKEEAIDHLHLAGDISNDFEQVTQAFLTELKRHVTVSYNLGNHDMLGLDEARIQAQEGRIIDFQQVQLISLAGWYDYSFNPTKTESQHLTSKNFYWFDRKLKRPASDPELTRQSLTKLEACLQETNKPVIVALHFVPHRKFIVDHPYFQRFNAFLGSQSFHDCFLKHGVKQVVFGHLHHRHDQIIDGIRYQARPLGYHREWQLVEDFFTHYPDYKIEPFYHLSKRYRAIKDLADYQTFYRQRLAEEFRQAMTIFEV